MSKEPAMQDRNEISRPNTVLRLQGATLSPREHLSARHLLLRVMRLIAIGGLNDAAAAAVLFGQFGRGHRRALILMRALMLELSRTSHRQIALAPPCCGRITRDEAVILRALARTESDFAACHDDARLLLGRDTALGAATCFQAVAACFADLGAPFD